MELEQATHRKLGFACPVHLLVQIKQQVRTV